MFAFGTIIGYAFGTFFALCERLIRRFFRLPGLIKWPMIGGIVWLTRSLWLPSLLELKALLDQG